jgi:hypothetical protein
MMILKRLNSWFSRRINNIDEKHLIDSMFVYALLDIFSWSFAFEEDKMTNLLKFLRKEYSKYSARAPAQVQEYAEVEFDLVIGAYEARCLLNYVGLCGGSDQCLLLPFVEETSQRRWCHQLDHLALRELHKIQHKKKNIHKRDVKEYRSRVRNARESAVCNVRILNKSKPLHPEASPFDLGTDNVYDFSRSFEMIEDNNDLMMKTQSVIDSINRLNYLSDSNSEYSLGSRHSSISHLEVEEGGGGGIFGDDGSHTEASQTAHNRNGVNTESLFDGQVEGDNRIVGENEEINGSPSATVCSSFASTAVVPIQEDAYH